MSFIYSERLTTKFLPGRECVPETGNRGSYRHKDDGFRSLANVPLEDIPDAVMRCYSLDEEGRPMEGCSRAGQQEQEEEIHLDDTIEKN